MRETINVRVAFDFDGTLFEESMFPYVGPIIKPMVQVLKDLHKMGVVILINTLRTSPRAAGKAIAMMEEYEIPYDFFNQNDPVLVARYGDSRKIGADIYVDDRSVGGLPTPSAVYKDVINLIFKKSSHGTL
jgi:hypothetical protein